MDDVVIGRELPADPGAVFDYLTRGDLLTQWWPNEADTDPRVGGSFRLHFAGPGVTLRGTYEVVDVPRRLRHTWIWDHEDDESVVDIELAPCARGTALRLRQTASTADERDGYRDGWEHFLGRLEGVLDG